MTGPGAGRTGPAGCVVPLPADPGRHRRAPVTRQRGALVAAIAGREHDGPFGEKITVSQATIDRWCRWWRGDGFAGLVPQPAQVHARTPAEVLDMAAGLKRENLARTATQVARILRASIGLVAVGTDPATALRTPRPARPGPIGPAQVEVFGRFEADRPNELWVGDALHGPVDRRPQDLPVRVPRRSQPAR